MLREINENQRRSDIALFGIMNSEGNQYAGNNADTGLKVVGLIVEKNMGTNCFKDWFLVQTVQKKKFRGTHAKAFERGYKSFSAGSSARCHNRDSDGRFEVRIGAASQPVVKPLEFR